MYVQPVFKNLQCHQRHPPSQFISGSQPGLLNSLANYATPQVWEFWEPSVQDFAFRKGYEHGREPSLRNRLPVLFNVESHERKVYRTCDPTYLASRPVQSC